MKNEVTVSAKTIAEAVAIGAAQLGAAEKDVRYEVIKEPKKGFLGIGETKAEVKVIYERDSVAVAAKFLRTILDDMDMTDCEITLESVKGNETSINVSGESAGALIGHHGETLDALQYILNLVANRKESDEDDRNYAKITLDIENYRAKRVETLEALARRMAGKVLKYRKNITLEPMSAYERRIIHSTVQGIQGVSTNSIGSDNNRRVVIFLEK